MRGSASGSALFNPETISLAGLTVGLLLIALVSVGGFTVLAQRRLRSLGLLASLGASERHIGLVVRADGLVVGLFGSAAGLLLGVGLWLAYRPHLEASSHHLVGVLALPWLVVAVSVVLAVAATYLAAARPARAVSRIPVVAALSGRPMPPEPVQRSALPGLVLLGVAFLLLGFSGGHAGGGGAAMPELVLGLVALIPAVVLLAPFCLAVAARAARRTPVSMRLALRDLGRYRARSGSALAAISVGVLIAVIIAIVAGVRYGNVLDYVGPNLAANQLVLHVPEGPPPGAPLTKGSGAPAAPTPAQLAAMGRRAAQIGAALGATRVVELESASASLYHQGAGRNWNGTVYVATPALLKAFGIDPATVEPSADVLTMRPGISSLGGMKIAYGAPSGQAGAGPPAPARRVGGRNVAATSPGGGSRACPSPACLSNPVIQQLASLPSGTSAPNTVLTEHAVDQLHLQTSTAGWLVQTSRPLTAAQIGSARQSAAAAGLRLETRNDEPSSAQVIDYATGFGVALALAILAMTVGLLRSETAGDLRTLTAAGASSWTRRNLSSATAGALALMGAVLGTFAGYVGVIGWLRSNSLNGGIGALGNVPVAQLLVILVGMPLAGAAVGWVLAGREPLAVARQPLS